MLIKVIATLAVANICCGFERDEKYNSNDSETTLDIFLRTMKISDYKVPEVDNLGDKLSYNYDER
jgi:hypothetical protein